MFLFHKKSFHMIPSAIIYNKKWNKREKCVFFVNQNFSMPVLLFGRCRAHFVGGLKYKIIKIKICWRMLRGKQYICICMSDWMNFYVCYSVGEIVLGVRPSNHFFITVFTLIHSMKIENILIRFFLHFISLKNHPPFNFHSFFIHTPLITWSRLDYRPYGWA